jgi:hypothetical protein
LADIPVPGDPHAHIHYTMFKAVATDDGHLGSLDSRKLTSNRIHELGGYFQAWLATELRALGILVASQSIKLLF